MEDTEAADLHTHGKRKRRIYRERRVGDLASLLRWGCYAALSLQVCLRVGSYVHGNAGARVQRGSALQAGGRQSVRGLQGA